MGPLRMNSGRIREYTRRTKNLTYYTTACNDLSTAPRLTTSATTHLHRTQYIEQTAWRLSRNHEVFYAARTHRQGTCPEFLSIGVQISCCITAHAKILLRLEFEKYICQDRATTSLLKLGQDVFQIGPPTTPEISKNTAGVTRFCPSSLSCRITRG